MTTQQLLETVNQFKKEINIASTKSKNEALEAMALALLEDTDAILKANTIDLEKAKGHISAVMLDRLRLDESRIQAMAEGIRQVAQLPDPVGEVIEETVGAQNIQIKKKRVPFGVIGIIYESRPNVTSDAVALSIKSGNAVVLRGGKEAYQSAFAIVTALKKGLAKTSISPECIQLVSDTSRESAMALMKAKGYIDVLIPRGGAGLIRAVIENAIVPVIETGTGIVHIYIDKDADLAKAIKIVKNAKMSRPSVCNAMEVCVVHEAIAPQFLPLLKATLVDNHTPAVELRVDEKAAQYISGVKAQKEDFDTEFSDYIMAVKVVSSIEEAVGHIETHSTHHSDAIISESDDAIEFFTTRVDSAAVYVNTSTRFTDGGEFGLGCEMGISTQKLHARGPMGLKEMTTYKYIVYGEGQVR